MATIAIGDIHGNILALNDLLEKVVPQLDSRDTLIFLGDYIDRGPDPFSCIERIIELQGQSQFRVRTLLGNHEDWMLKTLNDYRRHSWILGMEAFKTISSYSTDAAKALRQEIEKMGIKLITEKVRISYDIFFDLLPASHRSFFANLIPYFRTPDVVCVHGGVDTKGGAAEEQVDQVLIWGTDDFPDQYKGPDAIVYGHWNNMIIDQTGWPLPRIQGNRTYGIDTISAGVLTAIRFPDCRVIQSGRYLV